MPKSTAVVTFAEPEYAPGKLVLIRFDMPHADRHFIWCGRSMGWMPFKETSNAFFHLFDSEEAAAEAAQQYVTLPLREEIADAESTP